jgi:hypothetical protein
VGFRGRGPGTTSSRSPCCSTRGGSGRQLTFQQLLDSDGLWLTLAALIILFGSVTSALIGARPLRVLTTGTFVSIALLLFAVAH